MTTQQQQQQMAVIKNSDMEHYMEQDVINLSSTAFKKFTVEKDIAAYIKKQLDKKYGYFKFYLIFFN